MVEQRFRKVAPVCKTLPIAKAHPVSYSAVGCSPIWLPLTVVRFWEFCMSAIPVLLSGDGIVPHVGDMPSLYVFAGFPLAGRTNKSH